MQTHYFNNRKLNIFLLLLLVGGAMAGLFSRHFVLLVCLIISLTTISSTNAAVRRYKWEVKYEYKSQDCVNKLVLVINGKTPGPTIRAKQYDTIIVELKNSMLTENVAIHWHGIRQIGTPWADGTEGVTQCPILAGDTFTYQFVVDRVSYFPCNDNHVYAFGFCL